MKNVTSEFGATPGAVTPANAARGPAVPPPAVDASARKVFKSYDLDHNGSLSVRELRSALKRLDLVVTTEEAAEVLKDYDADRTRTLDLHEFDSLAAKLRSLKGTRARAIDRDGLMAAYRRDRLQEQKALQVQAQARPSWVQYVRLPDEAETCTFEWSEPHRAKAVEELLKTLGRQRRNGGNGGGSGGAAAAAAVTAEVQAIFDAYDCDASGGLSSRELRKALHQLGLSLTTEQAKAVLGEYDADGSRSLSADEFAQLVARLRAAPLDRQLLAPPQPGQTQAAAAHRAPLGPWRQGHHGNIQYDGRAARVAVYSEPW